MTEVVPPVVEYIQFNTIEEVVDVFKSSERSELLALIPLRLITNPKYLPVESGYIVQLKNQVGSAINQPGAINGIISPLWIMLLHEGPSFLLEIADGFHRYIVASALAQERGEREPLDTLIPVRITSGDRVDLLRLRLIGAGKHDEVIAARMAKFISDSWPFTDIAFSDVVGLYGSSRENVIKLFPGADPDLVLEIADLIINNLQLKPDQVRQYIIIAENLDPDLFDHIRQENVNVMGGEIHIRVALELARNPFTANNYPVQREFYEEMKKSNLGIGDSIRLIRRLGSRERRSADFELRTQDDTDLRLQSRMPANHIQEKSRPGRELPAGRRESQLIGRESRPERTKFLGLMPPDVSEELFHIWTEVEQTVSLVREAAQRVIELYASEQLQDIDEDRETFEGVFEIIVENILLFLIQDVVSRDKVIPYSDVFTKSRAVTVVDRILQEVKGVLDRKPDDFEEATREKIYLIFAQLELESERILNTFYNRYCGTLPEGSLSDINIVNQGLVVHIITCRLINKVVQTRKLLSALDEP